MKQSGFVASYKKYRSTMSCAIIAFCVDFLLSQYIDCLDSTCLFSNCLDLTSFNCTSSNYTSSNYTSSNYTSLNCTSLSIFTNYTCVDSCQNNCSGSPPPQSKPRLSDLAPFVSFNLIMLLAVVLPVIAVNTAILVALVLESSIVKVIRLVLASILISCFLSALGLAMYHIAEIVLSFSFPSVSNEPDSRPCTITFFLVVFGGTARLVFMATFAVAVYIIVKHGKATKKHLVVAVLVAVVVLWIITFLGNTPTLSHEIALTRYWHDLYCYPARAASGQSLFIFLGILLFSSCVVTPSVAVIFLLIICCNKHSITSATAVEKTMVKFGFFLFLGNGLNMIGLVVPGFISTTGGNYVYGASAIANPERLQLLLFIAFTFLNAGLIPTPILILIFFKSIRKRLLRWLCCCMAKKRKAKHNHNNNNNNNGEGRMVTATD